MLTIPRATLAAVLNGMSFVFIILALGCGLSAAISVLLIVGSLFGAVLKLIGFDWWADLETALYGVIALVTFAAGYFILYKTSDWAAGLSKRIEPRG